MPEIDVDSLANQQSVLVNQLFDSVAEERAIDDVLYHFTKTYSNETMELAVFIKASLKYCE